MHSEFPWNLTGVELLEWQQAFQECPLSVLVGLPSGEACTLAFQGVSDLNEP